MQSLPKIYSVGDLRPDVTATLNYAIAGHTITMRVLRPDGTLLEKSAIIDDDGVTSGVSAFHFEWSVGDLQEGWRQLVEILDVDASNRPMTLGPVFLNVKPKMVAVPP